MSESSPAHQHDPALDGLRGLAALAVLVNHIGVATVAGVRVPAWLLWVFDGRLAVMVFFVLSGYVIGLTYPMERQPKDITQYVLRRALRLVPITLLGILLACLAVGRFDLRSVLVNLCFLQNFAPYGHLSLPVIEGNENLWSLNYEVLYYVLFIVIWRYMLRLRWVALGSLTVAVLAWYTGLLPIFLGCYATGFLFWLGGLALAWSTKPAQHGRSNWPSCVLLLLVTYKLRGLLNVLAGFPIPTFDGPVVMLYFLDFLPACLWLVAIIARRKLPFERGVVAASVLIPLVGLVIKWHRPGYFTPLDYRLTLGAYVLALGLWRWRPSLEFFRRFAPLGLMAFALYAISRPIQTFFFAHTQWLPQNALGYVLCATLTVAVSVAISWYLERRMQPALKGWILRRRPASPAPEAKD